MPGQNTGGVVAPKTGPGEGAVDADVKANSMGTTYNQPNVTDYAPPGSMGK